MIRVMYACFTNKESVVPTYLKKITRYTVNYKEVQVLKIKLQCTGLLIIIFQHIVAVI